MKKLVLLVLLFTMLVPMTINAKNDDTCEQISTSSEKTIEVNVKQEIKNRANVNDEEISKFKFNYKILDLDDNVLAETTNDESGNITFHCFDVKLSDIGDYKLYKIIMDDNENVPFDYDSNIIYFSLRPNFSNGLFNPIIAFHKDDGDDSPERYNTKYKGEVFHATEEELQGQAYAVLDMDTGVLTFFRDEEGKYTNNQTDGNKKYYTGFENATNWTGNNNSWRNYKQSINKISFEDAVKPLSIDGWFSDMINLEELDISKLDTSLVTNLANFLIDDRKLTNVDISTMDTKNMKYLERAFKNSGIEYINFTYWNFESLEHRYFTELLNNATNLKYLNISNFNMESASAEFANLACLEKIVIGDDYDFYRSSFGYTDDKWFNPQKNKMYTASQIKDNLVEDTESMAGYYIRPMCTTEAVFTSNYNPRKTMSNELQNPDTGNILILSTILIIILLGIGTYNYGKKESNVKE